MVVEFIIPQHHYICTKSGKEVIFDHIGLLLETDDNILNAFLQIAPDTKGIGNGFPLRYIDKKLYFSMPQYMLCVIFHFGEYTLTIQSSYLRYEELLSCL